MKFKDINCGYHTTPQPNLLCSDFASVISKQEALGIVESAMLNLSRGSASIRQMNQTTLDFCRKSAGQARPIFHMVPPTYADEAYARSEILSLIDRDHPAFHFSPHRDACPMTDWLYGDYFNWFEESGSPVLVSLEEVDLQDFVALMERHKRLKVVILHTFQFYNRSYPMLAQHFENVFMEISDMIEFYGVENLAMNFGANKLLFGTAAPDKEPYDKIAQILFADLSEEQKSLIAYGNYDRLFNCGRID